MKKIIILAFNLLIAVISMAQMPNHTTTGSVNLWQENVGIPGAFGSVNSLKFKDTIEANASTPQIVKNIPGYQFFATDASVLWIRDFTHTQWVQINGGGGSGINIYNSDGTLAANRTVTGANKILTFSGVRTYNIITTSNSSVGFNVTTPNAAFNVNTNDINMQSAAGNEILFLHGLGGEAVVRANGNNVNDTTYFRITGRESYINTGNDGRKGYVGHGFKDSSGIMFYRDSSETIWTAFNSLMRNGTGWLTTGNSSTTGANYLGTNDSTSLRFRVNKYLVATFDSVMKELNMVNAIVIPTAKRLKLGDNNNGVFYDVDDYVKIQSRLGKFRFQDNAATETVAFNQNNNRFAQKIGIAGGADRAQLHIFASDSNIIKFTNLAGSARASFATGKSSDLVFVVSDSGIGKLVTQSSIGGGGGSGWNLTGNAGTNPASNFLGTTDAHRILLKSNNDEVFGGGLNHLRLSNNGDIVLDATDSTTDLQLSGNSVLVSRSYKTTVYAANDPMLYGDNIVTQLRNGGTTILTGVGSTGNVGIGTTAPAAMLDVNGNIIARDSIIGGSINDLNIISQNKINISANSDSAYIHMKSTGVIGIDIATTNKGISLTNNSTNSEILVDQSGSINILNPANTTYIGAGQNANESFMYFTPNARAGIGTFSPQSTLHILNNTDSLAMRIEAANMPLCTTADSLYGKTAAGNVGLIAASSLSGGGSQWTTTGSDIYNSNAGNVGIGTTVPTDKFNIQDGSTALFFGAANNRFYAYGSNGDDQIYHDYTNHQLHMYCNDNSSYNQTSNSFYLMNGNVGIGTGAPGATLEVNGNVIVSNLPSGSTTDSIVTADPSTGELHRINIGTFAQGNTFYTDNDSIHANRHLWGGRTRKDLTMDSLGEFTVQADEKLELIGGRYGVGSYAYLYPDSMSLYGNFSNAAGWLRLANGVDGDAIGGPSFQLRSSRGITDTNASWINGANGQLLLYSSYRVDGTYIEMDNGSFSIQVGEAGIGDAAFRIFKSNNSFEINNGLYTIQTDDAGHQVNFNFPTNVFGNKVEVDGESHLLGKVGIGLTNPATALQIAGTTTSQDLVPVTASTYTIGKINNPYLAVYADTFRTSGTSMYIGNAHMTDSGYAPSLIPMATVSGKVTYQSVMTALPYKTYQASITQSGTSAPSATSLVNTTGTTFTWARTTAGVYTVTAGSAVFTSGKTYITMSTPLTGLQTYICLPTSSTVCTLTTSLSAVVATVLTAVGTDTILTNTKVEIDIYP